MGSWTHFQSFRPGSRVCQLPTWWSPEPVWFSRETCLPVTGQEYNVLAQTFLLMVLTAYQTLSLPLGPAVSNLAFRCSMSSQLVTAPGPLCQEKPIVPALPDRWFPVIFFLQGKKKDHSKIPGASAVCPSCIYHNCVLHSWWGRAEGLTQPKCPWTPGSFHLGPQHQGYLFTHTLNGSLDGEDDAPLHGGWTSSQAGEEGQALE